MIHCTNCQNRFRMSELIHWFATQITIFYPPEGIAYFGKNLLQIFVSMVLVCRVLGLEQLIFQPIPREWVDCLIAGICIDYANFSLHNLSMMGISRILLGSHGLNDLRVCQTFLVVDIFTCVAYYLSQWPTMLRAISKLLSVLTCSKRSGYMEVLAKISWVSSALKILILWYWVISISIFPMRETLSDCLKGLCVLVTIVPVTCGSQRRAGILESAAHDEDEYRDDDDETELV